MVSKQLQFFGFISVAATLSGVLIGCGGSSATTSSIGGSIQTTGGVTTQLGSSTTPVPTSNSPQQIQVLTSGGGTVTGIVPPGQPAITTTTLVSVIPANVPFINGLSVPKFKGLGTLAHPVNISYNQGATWSYSGSNVQTDGSINPPIVLVAGTSEWLQAVGPFAFAGGTLFKPTQLTVQQFIFGIVVDSTGAASIPSGMNLKLPVNGGTVAAGNFVTVNYPTPNFNTGSGHLKITWPGEVSAQTRAISGGTATFNDALLVGKPNDNVPRSGVDLVQFIYQK